MQQSAEIKKNAGRMIIVFCMPLLIYLQSVSFRMTGFDDTPLLVENAAFLADFRNFAKAFGTDAFLNNATAFYRPLQTLSFMAEIQLSGSVNPGIHHLTNVLLSGFIASLIFMFLNTLLRRPWLALSATLLYSAHPLFVSSIVWIPARGDLLLTLFSLLSFAFLGRYLRSESSSDLFLHWFSFLLALFSKETAVCLPVLFMVYCFAISDRPFSKQRFPLFIGIYLVTGLCWYWLRMSAVSELPSENALYGVNALFANLRVIPESLASLFLPVNISPIPTYSFFRTAAGCVIIGVLAALMARFTAADRRTGLFSVFWFLLLLFPTLLFKHTMIDYLNHRLLLPSVGMVLFSCTAVEAYCRSRDCRPVPGILIPLLIVLSCYTFVRAREYGNSITFYDSVLSRNPASAFAFNNRGIAKSLGNDLLGAIADYDNAIQLKPAYEEAFNNRGLARLQLGQSSAAIADFSAAVTLNGSFAVPWYNRGRAYYNLHDYRRAIADFSTYTSMTRIPLDVHNYIGKSFAQIQDFQASIASFSRAIEVNPDQLSSYYNRAVARNLLRDHAGVIADCEIILAVRPGDADALRMKQLAIAALNDGSRGQSGR